jgi:hypothetical protein
LQNLQLMMDEVGKGEVARRQRERALVPVSQMEQAESRRDDGPHKRGWTRSVWMERLDVRWRDVEDGSLAMDR